MKQIVTALAALLVAGCAGMTPNDVRSKGSVYTAPSGQAPEIVGRCIQRNAENQTSYHLADVRPQGDYIEVIVRGIDTGWVQTGTVAVFDVRPNPQNVKRTVVRGWINPEEPADHQLVFNGFISGCY